jgi:hypothetical protein
MHFDMGKITVTQEYGTTHPVGWYSFYISNKKKQYFIDSISHFFKTYNRDEEVTIKEVSKIINKPINNINLIEEFNKITSNK